jgi:anti-sigma factor RsiW
MTCQQLINLLLEFVSGELDPQFLAEIHQHLQECPHCDAFVHSYRITITVSRRLTPVPLPSHFAQRLQNLLREMTENRGRE